MTAALRSIGYGSLGGLYSANRRRALIDSSLSGRNSNGSCSVAVGSDGSYDSSEDTNSMLDASPLDPGVGGAILAAS